LLSIAKDLLQKKDLTAIAERCGLRAHTLQLYRSRLVKATGARDLKEALEMLAPILAAQQEEGALDKNQAGIAGNGITEYEVGLLLLIAKRYTITEIADKLGIPTKEVERCRYTLYRKLGVTTSLDALATAIERNLISNILPRAKLSLRTQEMLRLLACGLTQGKVARIFSSTRAIFNNKLATLRKKMNVHSTNELITLARENGWMTDD
jgi:DNA-binding NarL/FixJ family response regulator